ncbi:MAG: ABC transporter ATP-binding protein [Pseudomonadota bacterium]
MKSTEAAIATTRLNLVRGDASILKSITLDIPAGAVVGLVGRNGAGKSSLLRCLAGLTATSSGTSFLLGCPSSNLTDAVRERLGFVAQTPDLFDWMQADEMLESIGRAYPRWSEQRVSALARRLDLRLDRKVSELSGGDQQKLAVVLALAHDPDLLLLDEPVASLDPLTRREFMRALFGAEGDAAERERTIVISSHILTDLERVVSHVAFMRDGAIQLFEAWDTLLEYFRLQPYEARGIPREAVVCVNHRSGERVVDMRRAAPDADGGRALTLDELFVELNA